MTHQTQILPFPARKQGPRYALTQRDTGCNPYRDLTDMYEAISHGRNNAVGEMQCLSDQSGEIFARAGGKN